MGNRREKNTTTAFFFTSRKKRDQRIPRGKKRGGSSPFGKADGELHSTISQKREGGPKSVKKEGGDSSSIL